MNKSSGKESHQGNIYIVPCIPFNVCIVFLGGSCNPTTWRKCIAIPYLEKHGVTYYNPVSLVYHLAKHSLFYCGTASR